MSLVPLHCVKLEEIIHIIIIIMTSSTSGPSPTPVSSKKKQRGCCMYRPPPNSFLLSQEDEDGLSHKVVLLLLLLLLFKFEPAWQQYHSLLTAFLVHSSARNAQGNGACSHSRNTQQAYRQRWRRDGGNSTVVAQALAPLMAPHCLLTCLLPSHYFGGSKRCMACGARL